MNYFNKKYELNIFEEFAMILILALLPLAEIQYKLAIVGLRAAQILFRL
jgi:hypothetical protein